MAIARGGEAGRRGGSGMRLPVAAGLLALLAAVGSGTGRPAAAQRSQFTQTFEYTNRIKSQARG